MTNSNVKQAKAFDLSKNEVQLPEPVFMKPLLTTGSGWPTSLETNSGIKYDYDPELTAQHDTPCYVQRA